MLYFQQKEYILALFQQHVNISVISSGIIIVPLHSSGMLTTNESLIALGLGVIGGMLPDLDSNNSKPTQIMFQLLSIFFPLVILLSIEQTLPILYIISIWLGASLLLNLTLLDIFLKLTVHRGIFHTIPMSLFFGQSTILISHHLIGVDATFSSLSGFFVFFGFITHLVLDEIYSIDTKEMKFKSSFGTALKFYDSNNPFGTFVLYSIVFYLFYIMPLDKTLYDQMFAIFRDIKII